MLAEAEQHISQIKMEELLEAVQKILLKKNQQIKLKRKIKKERWHYFQLRLEVFTMMISRRLLKKREE